MKTRIESTAERKRKRHHTTMPRIRMLSKSPKHRNKTNPKFKSNKWQKFYGNKAWHNLRESKLIEQPLCERCLSLGRITPATCVHHKKVYGDAMSEEQWYLFLNYDNLISLCDGCHKYVHATNELGWIEHNPVVIDDGT